MKESQPPFRRGKKLGAPLTGHKKISAPLTDGRKKGAPLKISADGRKFWD